VDDGPLTPDDLAYLDAERVARLATADAEGRPTAVPVCFARVGRRLYIGIDTKPKRGDPRVLKRLRNIRAQPNVALLLDRYDEDWGRLRWLLVRARARILEGGDERAAALAALEARYPQYAAMRLAALGLPVIALDPVGVSRWRGAGTA
jgi:PPOX class probable F420-dependent enzyme